MRTKYPLMSVVTGEVALRVGILGCSDIARRKFIPALLQSSHAHLAVVAARQPDKTDSLVPPGMNLKLMNYQDLVADPDIELIYISLPNHLHEEWSIRALEQGKHVLCEKPLALDAVAVGRMLDAADRNGRLLYENLMYLQHPQHSAVKAFISSGGIGRVLSMRSEFAFPGPVDGDFRLDPSMGGGAFHDMNRYPLSAAQFFLAGKTHHFIQGKDEQQTGLTVSFEAESVTDAGEKFSFMVAFGRSYRSFYEICGEQGTLRVDRAYTTPADMNNLIAVTVGGRDESFYVPPSDHFLNTIEHVCDLIHHGSWEAEHDRTRQLAELAGMFNDNCLRG